MIGYLNLFSLLLGVMAWVLPVVTLTRFTKQNHKNWASLSIISLSACAISLFFQIFYNYHLVKLGDWSALMDITGAVAFFAAVLLIVTVILNVITLILYRGRASN
ncbi:hypothetical protein [Bacillus norwichensis]|uniref:Cytochrome c oxidase subunit 4 n=1 Tax=Bacillus norwichensis TaxID=2762217 RepID=A0ABR8VQD2_9BACI|nr:hypothetical protein [Bacillus norwichensis]MBD8006973.1 hypothetical protein [Bacillus norwichensis]